MFRNFFAKRRPLTGAPAARRVKTYSAQSGFSYEYWYEGRRPYRSHWEGGAEFVFSVSIAPGKHIPVSVLLADAVVTAWEQSHARQFSSTELYAIAKMALFQAFDERLRPELMKAPIHVRPADVEAISETLGF